MIILKPSSGNTLLSTEEVRILWKTRMKDWSEFFRAEHTMLPRWWRTGPPPDLVSSGTRSVKIHPIRRRFKRCASSSIRCSWGSGKVNLTLSREVSCSRKRRQSRLWVTPMIEPEVVHRWQRRQHEYPAERHRRLHSGHRENRCADGHMNANSWENDWPYCHSQTWYCPRDGRAKTATTTRGSCPLAQYRTYLSHQCDGIRLTFCANT